MKTRVPSLALSVALLCHDGLECRFESQTGFSFLEELAGDDGKADLVNWTGHWRDHKPRSLALPSPDHHRTQITPTAERARILSHDARVHPKSNCS